MWSLENICGCLFFFFFQAEDGIRDYKVTGVQTCALPISWAGFSDSNFAFEVHQYLDYDSSGTHSTCVTGLGATVLNEFTSWARTNGVNGFLDRKSVV